jgi:nitrite reductase (NADH) small subunit
MMTMEHWIDICGLDDIPRLGARRVMVSGIPVAIFRTSADKLFAIEDRCPHKGGPLSQGIVHGNAVACPLHNWVIDLDAGEARAPDRGCVRRLPVRLSDGSVLLDAGAILVQAAE